jgi:hypothetical protein
MCERFLDIDLPARQFAGELAILPAETENQGNLIGFDDHDRTSFRLM